MRRYRALDGRNPHLVRGMQTERPLDHAPCASLGGGRLLGETKMDAWGYTDHDWRRIRQVIDYIRSFPRARESRGEVEPAKPIGTKKAGAPSVEVFQLGLPLFEIEGDLEVKSRMP